MLSFLWIKKETLSWVVLLRWCLTPTYSRLHLGWVKWIGPDFFLRNTAKKGLTAHKMGSRETELPQDTDLDRVLARGVSQFFVFTPSTSSTLVSQNAAATRRGEDVPLHNWTLLDAVMRCCRPPSALSAAGQRAVINSDSCYGFVIGGEFSTAIISCNKLAHYDVI